MLTFTGARRNNFCDRVARRDFLKIGGLAMGGLSLPQMLRAEQKTGEMAARHKGIIMIYMPGGPPHQDMYDLKPDAPMEIRGEFEPIATNVPGIEICEHMPRLATRMDRFAIVRSLVGSDGAHASTVCTSGWPWSNQPPGKWPQIGAFVSALQGTTDAAIPAAADLSMHMQHLPYNVPAAGFLGAGHTPFRPDGEVLADLAVAPAGMSRLADRKTLLEGLDRFRRQSDAARSASDFDDCTSQAFDLLTSSKVAEALDLDREDAAVRERYGKDDPEALPYSKAGYQALMSRFLLARRLIEAGVRCVTVSFADFDWHGNNFVYGRKVLPLFDQGITALVDDLHERGLAEDVSVVAWGEFGRTP
ncbi:MAG: DUF1501 domain-containing protein, partial [Pirellulales bacterium]